MFEVISSVQNTRVKNLVRLRDGTHRRRQNRFLIEGLREIQRAIQCCWPMETLFFCEDLFKDPQAYEILENAETASLEIIRMTPEAFAKGSFRQGPDGLLATGIQQDRQLETLEFKDIPFMIIAESLEKPGNIGAIFRTASAAGADALILANSVTDPYNPNVIRASQGAFFDLPFFQIESADLLLYLEEKGIQPVLTSPAGKALIWEADLRRPTAILLGSEDTGLSPEWLESYPAYQLPMQGVTDSLNVASMAAVCAFETVRQRTANSQV